MVYIQLEKTDFEVLSFLLGDINKEYSIKELAENLKRPYVKVHNSIKRLSTKGIIKEDVKGKSHYCSVNYKHSADVVCFVNTQRAKEFLSKNKKISLIAAQITSSMKLPDYSLILFGSYAKGDPDKHSDVDIAIITPAEDEEQTERTINHIKKFSPLKIHSLELTYKNFIEMLKSKEWNVGKEIAKNHIIFKGCEQFYECLRLAE